MRAVRFHRHGGPEVLQVDDIAPPGPPSGAQVLVAVSACSVNGTDLRLRRGDLGLATWGRLPFVPGFDLAGEVVACGEKVTAFVPGDRVMGLLGHGGGGLADRVLVRQQRLALVPRSVSTETAAALPLAGLTALQALLQHGRLQQRSPGTRVLVVGAAGGVGSYAVQLAKVLGCHVTAVARDSSWSYLAGLGVDELVDRDMGLGGGRVRFDVVLDAAGARTAQEVRPLLRESGGVAVSVRPVSKDVVLGAAARRLSRSAAPARRRTAAVVTRARSADLTRLSALVDEGRLRVPIDAVYGWDSAAAAHAHVEAGVRGKVLLVSARRRSDGAR